MTHPTADLASTATVTEPLTETETHHRPDLKPRGQEVWAIQIPGLVHLRVLAPSRLGVLVEGELSIGPNQVGRQFRIATEDREDNQARVADSAYDPFKNGILIRIDQDQQLDPDTASRQALTTEAILDLFDLPQAAFEAAAAGFGEIPLRRMVDIGTSMDVSHRKIDFVSTLIDERYSVAKSQPSMTSGKVEYLS